MGWESPDVVRFGLGHLLQGQTRIPKLKSPYKSLIIGPGGLQCEINYRKSWAGNLVKFDLGPLLQGKMRTAKLKSAYNLLIVGPRGLQCQTNL